MRMLGMRRITPRTELQPSSTLTTARSGWRTFLRQCLMTSLLVVIGGAIALALRDQDWSVLATVAAGRDPALFVLIAAAALGASSAATVLALFAWQTILIGIVPHISPLAAARIFLATQFAKFVPGKVLSYAVSIHMGRAVGVRAGQMVSAWLLTVAVMCLTGATIGLVVGPELIGGRAAWLALAGLPIVLVLVRPGLLDRLAAGAARLLRRSRPSVQVSHRRVRWAVLAQSLAWLLYGVQLWLIAVALGAPPVRSFLLCVGGFSLAAVAGTVFVFTPEGLGVREAILMLALSATLPLSVAGAVAVASRLIVTLAELATSGVGLLVIDINRRRRQRIGRADLDAPAGGFLPSPGSDRRRTRQ